MAAFFHLQLNCADPLTLSPSFKSAGRVAVTVIGPDVAPVQVATPNVWSCALLIVA
jgi:hypothetical protein